MYIVYILYVCTVYICYAYINAHTHTYICIYLKYIFVYINIHSGPSLVGCNWCSHMENRPRGKGNIFTLQCIILHNFILNKFYYKIQFI